MFNATLVINYIKHLAKAKTRHGVHSAFVYQLIDEVIYDFKKKSEYKNIELLRKNLLLDDKAITVTDLGAGSQVNNQKIKQVKQIAKNALKPKKFAQLLFRLAQHFKPKNIIELGTCLGVTTSYFSLAVPNAKIITLEGCPQTAAVAQENFNKLGLQNIETIVGNFDDTLPEIIENTKPLDFVFIDGNHRKDATINYFNWCLSYINPQSVIIFDDIYWSEGMKQAWEQIKEHPKVTVTIDLFWIGLVFFKEGQAKEHFRVRF
jgi:predicted O-methyltransferase YrrM